VQKLLRTILTSELESTASEMYHLLKVSLSIYSEHLNDLSLQYL